jgi:hypothetical protein
MKECLARSLFNNCYWVLTAGRTETFFVDTFTNLLRCGLKVEMTDNTKKYVGEIDVRKARLYTKNEREVNL